MNTAREQHDRGGHRILRRGSFALSLLVGTALTLVPLSSAAAAAGSGPTNLAMEIDCSGTTPAAAFSFWVSADAGSDLNGDGQRYLGPIAFAINGSQVWWGDTMTFAPDSLATVPLSLGYSGTLQAGDVVSAGIDIPDNTDPVTVPLHAAATVNCSPTSSPTPTPTPSVTTAAPTPSATESLPTASPAAPTPLDQAALVASALKDGLAPMSAVRGSTATIKLSTGLAGERVWAWLYSTPTALGQHTVAADGTFRVTIPQSVVLGAHRIAVLDPAGTLIGWDAITISAVNAVPGGATGLDEGSGAGSGPVVATIVLTILVSAGGVLLYLRRRQAARA